MCYIDCDDPIASVPKSPMTMICPNCRHRFLASDYCRERNEEINWKGTEEQEKQKKKKVKKEKETAVHSMTATCYIADFLVSHGYINGDSNFINVPTITHEPVVYQSAHCCSKVQFANFETMKFSCDAQTLAEQNPSLKLPINQLNNHLHINPLIMTMKNIGYGITSSKNHISTTCKPTNDSIIFTTSPNIHSGGCLIQSMETGTLVQVPPIEIQRKLTGGSCLVQKKHLPIENERLTMFKYMEDFSHQTFVMPPSGCLELPGNRKILPSFKITSENSETMGMESKQRKISIETNGCCFCNGTVQQNLCHGKLTDASDDRDSLLFEPVSNSMQIRVNANMQLPVNMNDCRINITATTAMPCSQIVTIKPHARNKQEQNEGIKWNGKEQEKQKKKEEKKEKKEKEAIIHSTTATCYIADLLVSRNYTNDNGSFINVPTIVHEPPIQSAHCFNAQFADSEIMELSNNLNKNVIMQPDNLHCATENRIIATRNSNSCNNNDRKNEASTISVSHPWEISSPWSLDTKLLNKDIRLREIRRLLQTCGWYHENISWKQSENLLRNTSIGRWLMRDSSDSRYIFAISVQTARGPTSVRMCYFLKHFQFDAEPGLALAIPTFECPITMLEHYVEYSKKMDRKEVWVDYSGQLYSQIYLTKPLIKEIKSLSHLARLVVNRNKLPTEHLPLLIRNYLAEYPYTL